MKLRKVFCYLLIFCLFTGVTSSYALTNVVENDTIVSEATVYDGSTQLNAIENLIAFQNDKDWDGRSEGFTDKAFCAYESSSDRSELLSNILGVVLLDYYKLPDSFNEYDNSYVLKLNYSVLKESRKYIDGINFMLVNLELVGNQWKVADHRVADTLALQNIPATKSLADSSVQNAIAKYEKRQMNGEITNNQGIVVDQIELEENAEKRAGPYGNPPTNINVKLTKQENATYYGVQLNTNRLITFDMYCRGVLPSEWYSSDPLQALQAGAILVKNYAWYYILNSQYSYDVTDSSSSYQSFQASMIGVTSTSTAVYNMWSHYMTKNGVIWSINYGSVTQNNTVTWANQGDNYSTILYRLYPSSTGVVVW